MDTEKATGRRSVLTPTEKAHQKERNKNNSGGVQGGTRRGVIRMKEEPSKTMEAVHRVCLTSHTCSPRYDQIGICVCVWRGGIILFSLFTTTDTLAARSNWNSNASLQTYLRQSIVFGTWVTHTPLHYVNTCLFVRLLICKANHHVIRLKNRNFNYLLLALIWSHSFENLASDNFRLPVRRCLIPVSHTSPRSSCEKASVSAKTSVKMLQRDSLSLPSSSVNSQKWGRWKFFGNIQITAAALNPLWSLKCATGKTELFYTQLLS